MASPALHLHVDPTPLAIVRRAATDEIPSWAFAGPGPAAVVRRDGELSIVCAQARVPAGEVRAEGWRALEVAGPLALQLTGVLSAIAGPLAAAGIPLFAVSTSDTDLVLVRQDDLRAAATALVEAGHRVTRPGDVSRVS